MKSIGPRHVTEVLCLDVMNEQAPCEWEYFPTTTEWKEAYKASVAHSRKTGHPVKIYFEQSITIRRKKHE